MVSRASWTGAATAVGCRRQCIHDFLTCYTLRCVLAQPILSQRGRSGLKLLHSANSQCLAHGLFRLSARGHAEVRSRITFVTSLADLCRCEAERVLVSAKQRYSVLRRCAEGNCSQRSGCHVVANGAPLALSVLGHTTASSGKAIAGTAIAWDAVLSTIPAVSSVKRQTSQMHHLIDAR